MMFRPATSLLCSSVWCALSTPRLGQRLAARRARQREGHDAGQVPLEGQLDERDHLVVRPATAGRSSASWCRCRSGASPRRAGAATPPAGGAGAERGELARCWPSRPRASRRPGRRACGRAPSPCPARAWRRRCRPAGNRSGSSCASSAARSLLVSVAGWLLSPWSRAGSPAASACRRPARRPGSARSRCRTASRPAWRLRYEM